MDAPLLMHQFGVRRALSLSLLHPAYCAGLHPERLAGAAGGEVRIPLPPMVFFKIGKPMNPLPYITAAVCCVNRLQVDGTHHIPVQGPVLIATAHDSPLDLFYHLSLMRQVRRQDLRFVMAAEMVDPERFRPYTRDAIAQAVPWATVLAGPAARMGSWVIPGLLGRLNPIPIYRQGDDSASRAESLACLLSGGVVTIAPEQGNDNHRGADGQRPLTHGVARCRDGWRPSMRLRIGPPLRIMSAGEYPDLFSPHHRNNPTVKHQAYQHFTQQLAGRLSALSG
jgi:hypothetical protein